MTRLDSLVYGIAGAYVAHYFPRAWSRHKNVLFAAGILLFIVWRVTFVKDISHGLYLCVFSTSVASLATLLLLPLLSELKTGEGFFYSLVHFWILRAYRSLGASGHWWIAEYLCFWGVTVAGSILLYKYFERPMMDLRDKLAA